MSIKGITQELFVGKTEVNIFTFIGNQINIPYSNLKRIDYCFAERLKPGFMNFIKKDNSINKFEFGFKENDLIQKTADFIKEHCPSMDIRQCGFDDVKKDSSVYIVPVFGHKELGLPLAGFLMHQKSTGEIYFNRDTRNFYTLLDYEWDGPEFDKITQRQEHGITESETKTNGKSLKMGAGALVGSMFGPAGALIGTAVGAGGKKKSKTQGQTHTNSTEVAKNVEKNTNATITIKDCDGNKVFKLCFKCNRDLDAKIKCFKFEKAETQKDVVESVSTSLEGIKALKELLDIGAITQEEFDRKKQQILSL